MNFKIPSAIQREISFVVENQTYRFSIWFLDKSVDNIPQWRQGQIYCSTLFKSLPSRPGTFHSLASEYQRISHVYNNF